MGTSDAREAQIHEDRQGADHGDDSAISLQDAILEECLRRMQISVFVITTNSYGHNYRRL